MSVLLNKSFFGKLLIGLLLLQITSLAQAILRIEITQGIEGALPIAIVPFGIEAENYKPQYRVADIVSTDLGRSGKFKPAKKSEMKQMPHYVKDINYALWRAQGIENLVVGRIRSAGGSKIEIQFQLIDVIRKRQLLGYSLPTDIKRLRNAAHDISDIIYEKITGSPGSFNTRMAYIKALGDSIDDRHYVLQVADSDGFNAHTVLESNEPLMSPSWSHDGRSLAYVSFENRRSEIYIQKLATAKRIKISGFSGINGAPMWSPDDRFLALTLSKDGNPEIYLLEIATRRLRRLTKNRAIDTEPVWLPDGKSLIFTSDRSGGPQLYERSIDINSRSKRLTFEGKYNARAAVSPDGKNIAMVHAEQGKYRIAVMDRATSNLRVLTDGSLDESPSFAPNSDMILYASTEKFRGVLSAISVDGRVQQRLSLADGDVREPAWSPFKETRR